MSKLFRFVENGEDAVSVTENAECDLTDNEADEALDDLEEDHVVNGNEVEDDQVECEEEQQEPEIVDPYAGLTEEEKEAKIRQEQIMAKKQKVNLHKVDLCLVTYHTCLNYRLVVKIIIPRSKNVNNKNSMWQALTKKIEQVRKIFTFVSRWLSWSFVCSFVISTLTK